MFHILLCLFPRGLTNYFICLSSAKFGVETSEFDDGLVVYGRPASSLKSGVRVHCYDDHRVAMAFSVLGTIIQDTIIEEKRCVEKTWPNWWDDLENKVCSLKPSATPLMLKVITDWSQSGGR